MAKTFFTSDTHFFHDNVIKFCNRPYGSVEHMNEELIKNWNSVVSVEDHIWFLGDFSFGNVPDTCSVLERLAGIKHLITGNHDRKGRCQKLPWENYFVDQRDYYRLKPGKDQPKIVLCHFPLASWERGYYHFHGHWHTLKGDNSGRVWHRHDVGVDNNNYTPILLSDACKKADETERNYFDK